MWKVFGIILTVRNDKTTDHRLRRKYGISLAEYNRMLAQQNGVCAICLNPPKARRLSVDHDHRYRKLKIRAVREEAGRWVAGVVDTLKRYTVFRRAARKLVAVREVREILKRRSVRGLLCWGCNSGLQKYADDPDRLERAAEYSRRFRATTAP
jgi:hypothetical protein